MEKSFTQPPPPGKPRLPRRARAEFLVVKELEPLRDSPAGRLDVRIVEIRGGARRLDLRQYITAETFTGYSRKGVSLSAEEFAALLEQRDAILRLLDGGRG